MGYTWRSLTLDDVHRWSDLTKVLAEHDATEEIYSPEDLAEELQFHETDPCLDTWAVVTDEGELAGFGQLNFRAALVEGEFAANAGGGVHPHHRRRGLGSDLLRRMEQRSVTAGAERAPGRPVTVRLSTGVQVDAARRLFARHGYSEQRFFFDMKHDLTGVVRADGLPPRIRRYERGRDDDSVLAAHTVAFASHWRAAPWSPEEWANRITRSRTFRPNQSFVVTGSAPQAGDETVAGYLLSFEYVPGELYVGLLGVLPAGRNRGLGTALLQTVLATAVGDGYRTVALDVDSANSTGAGRLYEAVGFRTVSSTVAALKTLPAPNAVSAS